MTTGYAYHEVFGWHDTSSAAGVFPSDPAAGLQPFIHLENAETKRRLHELVVVSGLVDHLVRIPTREATNEEILRVHSPTHLARIAAESELPKGGGAGEGISPFGHGGFAIARRAAGTVRCYEYALAVGTGAVGVSPARPRRVRHDWQRRALCRCGRGGSRRCGRTRTAARR
jgi:acetoin utilization deacetylase AcuC-like enzyme